jgi:hypothetical protein
MRDQRQPDYVNLYFGWVVWRAISRVLGAIGAGCVIVGWFVVYEIAPQYGVPYLEIVFGGIVLAIPVLIVVGFYQAFRKRPDPMRNWAPASALSNPPEPWFDSNGNRLWRREGDRWVRTTVLQRDKS